MTWSLGWNFRKSKAVNGTTFGSQTNYTLQLNVFKGSGTDTNTDIYLNNNCNDDFSDIRFTSSDGVTPLDYYIESMTTGISAVIDIEIDYIPEDLGSTNIYVYYGNLTAVSESNAGNTFLLYDTSWSGNWEKLLGTWYNYPSGMYLYANSMATTKNSIPLNCEIKYYIYGYGNAYYAPEDTLRDIKLAKETTERNFCRFSQTYGGWSYVSRNTSEEESQTFSLSPLTGHTAIIRHTLNGDWVLIINGTTVQTQPSLRTSGDVLYLHFSAGGYPSLIAYVIIRKYALPEPTFDVTGAEEAAPGDVCIKSNPSGASITIDGILQSGKTTTSSGTSCAIDNTVIGLSPGIDNHSYEINFAGYQPKSGNFSIVSNILTEIDVGNLILMPTTGDVNFHVTCEGIPCADAYITIDTNTYGPTDASGIITVTGLPPGPVNYTVLKTGYYDGSESVTVIVGSIVDAPIVDLVPISTTGSVCIKSNPSGASITIDGIIQSGKITALSETSCISDNIVTGLSPCTDNHSYEINLTGYQPKSGNFSIIVGTLTQVEAGNLIPIPVSAGSGGFVLLSLGLLFGLLLIKKKCEDKHTKEECEQAGCQWKDGICI